jgi:hypothetical protein
MALIDSSTFIPMFVAFDCEGFVWGYGVDALSALYDASQYTEVDCDTLPLSIFVGNDNDESL